MSKEKIWKPQKWIFHGLFQLISQKLEVKFQMLIDKSLNKPIRMVVSLLKSAIDGYV
jgi:hypothetical protein